MLAAETTAPDRIRTAGSARRQAERVRPESQGHQPTATGLWALLLAFLQALTRGLRTVLGAKKPEEVRTSNPLPPTSTHSFSQVAQYRLPHKTGPPPVARKETTEEGRKATQGATSGWFGRLAAWLVGAARSEAAGVAAAVGALEVDATEGGAVRLVEGRNARVVGQAAGAATGGGRFGGQEEQGRQECREGHASKVTRPEGGSSGD